MELTPEQLSACATEGPANTAPPESLLMRTNRRLKEAEEQVLRLKELAELLRLQEQAELASVPNRPT